MRGGIVEISTSSAKVCKICKHLSAKACNVGEKTHFLTSQYLDNLFSRILSE